MSKGTNISVTRQANGVYRKQIGKQFGRNGKLKPKTFYLGRDETEAKAEALRLVAEWSEHKRQGLRAWPSMRAKKRKPQAEPQSVEVEVNASDLTFADAAAHRLADIEIRFNDDEVSGAHLRTAKYRSPLAVKAMGKKLKLCDIGPQEIKNAVRSVKKRPKRADGKGRISIRQVQNIVKEIQSILRYIDEELETDYQPPKALKKLLTINKDKLRTAKERQADKAKAINGGRIDTFSMDELRTIWDHAPGKLRCYMLLALNCGWTSVEISGFKKSDIYLDTDPPKIIKMRGKTDIIAEWMLWSETIAMLNEHGAPSNEENHVLLNERELPLLRVDYKRTDAIYCSWKRTMAKVKGEVQPLGFRFLRKTGANWMRQKCNLEISEMYLSHKEVGMSTAYANRPWHRLHDALGEFRKALPMIG